jgi:hypothetical protein
MIRNASARGFLVISLLLSMQLIFSGCGPSGPRLYPVTGVVHVSEKPAEHALVFLHRNGRDALTEQMPYGKCDASGAYVIETPGRGPGAVEGDYVITVYWPDMSKPEAGNGERPDALNGAYEIPEKSTLKTTVKSGKNEIPRLDLKPGPPKRNPSMDSSSLK